MRIETYKRDNKKLSFPKEMPNECTEEDLVTYGINPKKFKNALSKFLDILDIKYKKGFRLSSWHRKEITIGLRDLVYVPKIDLPFPIEITISKTTKGLYVFLVRGFDTIFRCEKEDIFKTIDMIDEALLNHKIIYEERVAELIRYVESIGLNPEDIDYTGRSVVFANNETGESVTLNKYKLSPTFHRVQPNLTKL